MVRQSFAMMYLIYRARTALSKQGLPALDPNFQTSHQEETRPETCPNCDLSCKWDKCFARLQKIASEESWAVGPTNSEARLLRTSSGRMLTNRKQAVGIAATSLIPLKNLPKKSGTQVNSCEVVCRWISQICRRTTTNYRNLQEGPCLPYPTTCHCPIVPKCCGFPPKHPS